MSERKGLLLVVSAPSGSGKTSLCRKMAQLLTNVEYSISYTTRPARPGEIDGKDYVFVNKERFEELIRENKFAEWAEVHDKLYGTHEESIQELMHRGIDVILDVNGQGAASLKKRFPEGIFIYILPPSLQALKERLYERKSDSAEEIERRLKEARREILNLDMYSYRIINDDFDQACQELKSVILSERVRLHPGETDRIKKRLLEGALLTGKEG